MATFENQITARHIQNYSDATSLEPHWGYYDRALPCTNDAGSCEYLDQVYHNHDLAMLYSGILWCTIAGIVFAWAVGRRFWPSKQADAVVLDDEKAAVNPGPASRLKRSLATASRSYLLPDSIRSIFGRTTRLQVLILASLAGYLLIWSFVGIEYKKWITPVKKTSLYNTRSSLGPFCDRIGVLAYALTPLSVMLSSRESILSLLTGVPYQSFNFLHRWLGYIIVIQGLVHTIGWVVIEAVLYQPQPTTAVEWIKQTYMIWGCVAIILLILLFVLSTPWAIRLTGYEFFRKAHYVLAMLYIGACWGHWEQLKCFMLPSLLLWFVDRGARYIRTLLIHYQYLSDGSMGFQAAQATLTHFPDAEHGDILRMDFKHNHEAWQIGEHFYLCFTEGSIWQSHPFTPLNLPVVKDGTVSHSYILRAKGGETKKIADLALKKLSEKTATTTPVILTGPYGESITETLTPDVNVLCIAGGTGITYVLPVLLRLIQEPGARDRRIELVWAVRKKDDIKWVQQELDLIRAASKSHGVAVHIFVTREQSPAPSLQDGKTGNETEGIKEVGSESSSLRSWDVRRIGEEDQHIHPDLEKKVNSFVENTVRGRTTVYASGPGGMISDLRTIVASCNSAAKVWKGHERFDVGLVCDDRLEW
ncbi:ferric reductase like transmembrane component-domain-containing protein [Truncatella angustata]|uniref:Ferric reductase like transmembrane component-domain-containing protein n=1 Tax=Truncatella angustata TaxID=152316 RepID=A0A9P8ZWM9_9PEZI|nr:ferric reductase like transmembrane component-domain-containing protein [Truncatella angustata]KAH6652262.1 ferric reductase like transmembrane component-domain-containing protein [Truncatella angustata]